MFVYNLISMCFYLAADSSKSAFLAMWVKHIYFNDHLNKTLPLLFSSVGEPES